MTDNPWWTPGGAEWLKNKALPRVELFFSPPACQAPRSTGWHRSCLSSIALSPILLSLQVKSVLGFIFLSERIQEFSSLQELIWISPPPPPPLYRTATLSVEVGPSLACVPFSSDAVRLVYKLIIPLSCQTTKNLEEYQW